MRKTARLCQSSQIEERRKQTLDMYTNKKKHLFTNVKYQFMCLTNKNVAYVLTYLKMPLMSTSLMAAFTMGNLTSAGPRPISTITPPALVACNVKDEH